MFPVATTAGGQAFGAPDVCLTPLPKPVPVPYPNTGDLNTTMATSPTVFIQNMPVVVLTSVIPMSHGDEPGVLLGVTSGTVMGPVKFLQGSSCVYASGQPVVFLSAVTGQNGASLNVPGTVVSVGQTAVITAP